MTLANYLKLNGVKSIRLLADHFGVSEPTLWRRYKKSVEAIDKMIVIYLTDKKEDK